MSTYWGRAFSAGDYRLMYSQPSFHNVVALYYYSTNYTLSDKSLALLCVSCEGWDVLDQVGLTNMLCPSQGHTHLCKAAILHIGRIFFSFTEPTHACKLCKSNGLIVCLFVIIRQIGLISIYSTPGRTFWYRIYHRNICHIHDLLQSVLSLIS